MNGSRLSIRWKSTATYAVAGSKCDGSIIRIVPHAGSPVMFFVTSVHCPPPVFVYQSLPSLVPAQMRPCWIGDGAIANTTSP